MDGRDVASVTNAPVDRSKLGLTTAVAGQLCTVQLPGGGVLQARGDAAVGDRVFVRDGLIEGLAPALTVVAIDI